MLLAHVPRPSETWDYQHGTWHMVVQHNGTWSGKRFVFRTLRSASAAEAELEGEDGARRILRQDVDVG